MASIGGLPAAGDSQGTTVRPGNGQLNWTRLVAGRRSVQAGAAGRDGRSLWAPRAGGSSAGGAKVWR